MQEDQFGGGKEPRPDDEPLTDDNTVSEEDGEQDFASLFESSEAGREARILKDSKVEGTIISVGEEWVFIDVDAKTEGSIAREELLDEQGELTVGVGNKITAYVVSARDGDIRLSVKMTSAVTEEALLDAYRSGVPVEGLVVSERKGGYAVRVFGKDAFCPYSQMDLPSGGKAEDYIDSKFEFRVVEYSERGRNVVLSRRQILEEERAKQVAELKKTLQAGDVVEGTVRNIVDFGVFVDIGGVEGLVPMSQLAWGRVEDASEVVQTGDRIQVQVMNVDWDNNRISLSRKERLEDPWTALSQRFAEGQTVSGRVTKLMNFGAFVQLEPGVEGLVHISEMSAGRRINHPREVVAEGDTVDVTILAIDEKAKRMSLQIKRAEEEGSAEESEPLVRGAVVFGSVEAVKDYGLFVRLPGGKSGLLHISEIAGGKGVDLKKRFPVGDKIEVEVLDIDPKTDRISLSSKTLASREEHAEFKDFEKAKGSSGSLGTLGDLLKDRLRK